MLLTSNASAKFSAGYA